MKRDRTPEEWMDLLVALPLALFVFGSGIFFLLRFLLEWARADR